MDNFRVEAKWLRESGGWTASGMSFATEAEARLEVDFKLKKMPLMRSGDFIEVRRISDGAVLFRKDVPDAVEQAEKIAALEKEVAALKIAARELYRLPHVHYLVNEGPVGL